MMDELAISNYYAKYKTLPIQVRASLWFLICSFLQRGISMITTPVFTRIMSTDDFGQFGVFNSWYGILYIIVALALTGGVHVQGLIKFDDRAKFSSSLQGLSITLIGAWFLIYIATYSFWDNLLSLSKIEMVAMFVIIWTTAVFGLWANEQRVNYSYRILVSVTIISSIIRPIIEIVFVTNSTEKATARILGWMISEVISFGWMFVYQLIKGKTFFSHKYWIYAVTFNTPLVPHYLSQTVLNSADRIMIQRMVGESEAGIYNLAYSVSLIMTVFNTALLQTISPWMYQKIKERRINDLASVAYLTLIIIAIVNLMLILLAPEIIAVFAPKEYYDAIWVVPPVAMSVYFMFSYDLFAKVAFYYEKTKAIMFASILGAILNIVLNYIFISIFGYCAAGYTTLICYIVYTTAHYIFMRKVCRECCESKYPYDTKRIIQITIPFIMLGFVIMGTYNYPIIRYGIVCGAVVLVIIFRNKVFNTIKLLLAYKQKAE